MGVEVEVVGVVVLQGDDALYFGEAVVDEALGDGGAVDDAVVPEGSHAEPVVLVEVGEEVYEGVLGVVLAHFEVVDDDVGVGQQSHPYIELYRML